MNKLSENPRFQKVMSWTASSLVLAFFLLVTLGSYVKIKTVVVIVYTVIAAILLIPVLKKGIREFLHSPLLWLWIAYCIVGLLSTVFIAKERDMYILISEVTFTFILFSLTRHIRYEDFFKLFRIYVLILVLIAFFQSITGILVFQFLKEGTQFIAEDKTHGILSLFEYRHYFGCYILLAFFSLFFYPARYLILNLLYGAVFLLAVVLTYTRGIWIAFVVGMLLLLIFALVQLVKRNQAGEKRGRRKLSRGSIIVLIVFALAAVVFVIVFRESFASIWARAIKRITVLNPKQNSWYNRMFTIINGPKYLFANPKLLPIGGGAGSALKWLETVEGARFRGAIDCQYVHTLLETGVIGLTLFLAMIVYTFIRFFRSKEKEEQLFALEYLAVAAALFFFEAVVVNSSVYALWVFVLVSLCRRSSLSHKRSSGTMKRQSTASTR